jgi:hypothetical protein
MVDDEKPTLLVVTFCMLNYIKLEVEDAVVIIEDWGTPSTSTSPTCRCSLEQWAA